MIARRRVHHLFPHLLTRLILIATILVFQRPTRCNGHDHGHAQVCRTIARRMQTALTLVCGVMIGVVLKSQVCVAARFLFPTK